MKEIIDIYNYFNEIRFKVIGDYPYPKDIPWYQKDDIFEIKKENRSYFSNYPHLFEKLKWYENRTIDEIIKIKFIEVLEPNYYIKGDKINVSSYIWKNLDTTNPSIIGFTCNGHDFSFSECFPANEKKLKENFI